MSTVATLVIATRSAAACPTCRDALALSDAKWAHGFSVSVLFLLGALAAILSTFSFAVWRAMRSPPDD
jgi:hypothetical protein